MSKVGFVKLMYRLLSAVAHLSMSCVRRWSGLSMRESMLVSCVSAAYLVVHEVLDVQLVEVGGHVAAEAQRDLLGQELQVGVDEGGGEGQEAQLGQRGQEAHEVVLHDPLHDLAVHVADVDAEEGADGQEGRERGQVEDHGAGPRRHGDLEQLGEIAQEVHVDQAVVLLPSRATTWRPCFLRWLLLTSSPISTPWFWFLETRMSASEISPRPVS